MAVGKNNKKIIIAVILLMVAISITAGSCSYINRDYRYAGNLCSVIAKYDNEELDRLLQKNGDVNSYDHPLYMRGLLNRLEVGLHTPLIVACDYNNYEAVKALLEKGADPNKFLKGGWSPMEATAVQNYSPAGRGADKLKIFRLLLEYGADVDSYGSYYPALITIARRYPFYCNSDSYNGEEYALEITKLLVEAGAATTAPSRYGDKNSVLHFACEANSLQLITYFVEECGLDINQQNDYGLTPLMMACKSEYLKLDIVEYLVQYGADINIVSSDGKTAFDFTRENSSEIDERIFKLLE